VTTFSFITCLLCKYKSLLGYLVAGRVELKQFIKDSLEAVVPSLEQLETSAFAEAIEGKYVKIGVCPRGFCECELLRCTQCQHPRFNHCTYPSCKNIGYDMCMHRIESKTDKKFLFYRPILPLLMELLQTRYFLEYCAHALKFVQANPWNAGEAYMYSDILTGAEAQKHVLDVHARFRMFEKTLPFEVKEVSMLAADYYDGVKMCQRMKIAKYYWPLFICFVSLPVSVRGNYGAGCVFWGFMNSKPGSNVEEFLFRDCVVPELQSLEEGVHMECNGIHYYIQLRLIVHVYDSRAKEHVEKYKGGGSYGGCIRCKANPGISCSVNKDAKEPIEGQLKKRTKNSTVYYQGVRHGLDMEHELRSFGQTRRCCIKNYYTSNGKVEEKKNNTAQNKESRIDIKHLDKLRFCLPAQPQQDLRNFLLGARYYKWESYNGEEGNFVIQDFSGNLYYPHCDYNNKEKEDYNKGTTVSNYLESGLAVLQQKMKKNREAAIKQNNGKKIIGGVIIITLFFLFL
jgi:hypothetical protein